MKRMWPSSRARMIRRVPRLSSNDRPRSISLSVSPRLLFVICVVRYCSAMFVVYIIVDEKSIVEMNLL